MKICQEISIIKTGRGGALDVAVRVWWEGNGRKLRSIDIHRWNRLGYFGLPHWFSWAWTRDGKKVASIVVEAKRHSVTLHYKCRLYGEDWNDVDQEVPINWTPCRFGGERPFFVCSVRSNGVYCGRRVTKLHAGGRLFACRHCYGLAYSSQQESAHDRGLGKAQKIRIRLGASANMLHDFPNKPKGMHWRTYDQLRGVHDAAEARSVFGMLQFVDRLRRRSLRGGRACQGSGLRGA